MPANSLYFQHLVVFPILKGQKINVVAFCSEPTKEGTVFSENPHDWVANVTQEELLQQYSGWEDEVISLLKVSLNCYGYG